MNTSKGFPSANRKATVPSQSDYFPWQRTSRDERSKHSGSLSSAKSETQSRSFSVATNHTACSSVCRHSWNKKTSNVGPVNMDEEKKKQKLLAVLKMQLKMKETSLCEYKKCYEELRKENINLKEEIASSEDRTHAEAKTLLQRYEKFRGAIGTLNKQYTRQLETCREEFTETKQEILRDIEGIELQVDDLNQRLLMKNNEVKTLLNYKDKEYPGKALQIAKLKRQRERLNIAQKEELEELNNTMKEDRLQSLAEEELLHKGMRYDINEEVVRSINPNMEELALQNLIMSKEIDVHQNEIRQLESYNSKLEEEIRATLGDRSLNPAEQLFPDIFQPKTKCLPQDEISLDIPVRTWLPI